MFIPVRMTVIKLKSGGECALCTCLSQKSGILMGGGGGLWMGIVLSNINLYVPHWLNLSVPYA